ncbi:MAG: lipoate--protein ligase [Solobacterium sp.]|nr:lipoate--protein ligase [Solobacterium sp.]
MKRLVSPVCDPYQNIAVERQLFDDYDGEDTAFLWVNDPCVVIGRNQNPWLETDRDAMKQEGVLLCRRYTGGGAVYQDRGNLNYSWISRDTTPQRMISMITEVLKSFGIKAVRSERNDLMIDDRKFSGTASLRDDGISLYHGTLMISVDRERLARVLTPSRLKIESHGIDSVRSRVMNLSDMADISTEAFTARFLELFPGDDIPWTGQKESVRMRRNELSSAEWLLEQTPGFDALLEYRINGSLYQAAVKTDSGRITEAILYTDSLDPFGLEHVSERMKGCLFDRDTLEEIIKEAVQ